MALKVPEKMPEKANHKRMTIFQVVVKVNDLVASCLGAECSYHHLIERTPIVTNTSTTSGAAGNTVTVTGTGFSNNASDVTVTLGDKKCAVQSSSETTIVFTIGQYSQGNVFAISI